MRNQHLAIDPGCVTNLGPWVGLTCHSGLLQHWRLTGADVCGHDTKCLSSTCLQPTYTTVSKYVVTGSYLRQQALWVGYCRGNRHALHRCRRFEYYRRLQPTQKNRLLEASSRHHHSKGFGHRGPVPTSLQHWPKLSLAVDVH